MRTVDNWEVIELLLETRDIGPSHIKSKPPYTLNYGNGGGDYERTLDPPYTLNYGNGSGDYERTLDCTAPHLNYKCEWYRKL